MPFGRLALHGCYNDSLAVLTDDGVIGVYGYVYHTYKTPHQLVRISLHMQWFWQGFPVKGNIRTGDSICTQNLFESLCSKQLELHAADAGNFTLIEAPCQPNTAICKSNLWQLHKFHLQPARTANSPAPKTALDSPLSPLATLHFCAMLQCLYPPQADREHMHRCCCWLLCSPLRSDYIGRLSIEQQQVQETLRGW